MQDRPETGLLDQTLYCCSGEPQILIVGKATLELVWIVALPYRVAEEADPLWNHGNEDPAPRSEDSTAFFECFASPRDVIQAGKQGNRVEGPIREWETGALAADLNFRVGMDVHTDSVTVGSDEEAVPAADIQQLATAVRERRAHPLVVYGGEPQPKRSFLTEPKVEREKQVISRALPES